MFLRNMASIAHRIAVVDGFDNKLTYGELEKISEDYKRCIPTRSLVMILCDYAIETIAFYYSQLSNESVPMLIDRKTKPVSHTRTMIRILTENHDFDIVDRTGIESRKNP